MLISVPTAPEIHPMQATKHQRYDVRFAHQRLRLMVAASFECQMDTPQLQCEVTSDLTQVKFRCGYCNRYHYHGNSEKHSPLKGHRVSHCVITPDLYPNGYYLRTDLDKITSERFPNFAVVGRNVKESNVHFHKCKRLSMPFCVVNRRRNYEFTNDEASYGVHRRLRLSACFTVDFITTESLGMDAVIGKAIREFRVLYRASHPARRLNRKHLYDSIMTKSGVSLRFFGFTSTTSM